MNNAVPTAPPPASVIASVHRKLSAPAQRALRQSIVNVQRKSVFRDNQDENACCLTEDCKAHYVVTAVKGNQPTIHDDLAAIDWRAARWSGDAIDKGHGRIETRRCAVLRVNSI